MNETIGLTLLSLAALCLLLLVWAYSNHDEPTVHQDDWAYYAITNVRKVTNKEDKQ